MSEPIKITRDCKAMLIPSGVEVTLAKDNIVQITHTLGGKFTVRGIFGIARIQSQDADALGLSPDSIEISQSVEAKESDNTKVANTQNSSSNLTEKVAQSNLPPPTEAELWEVAKTVFDPEIPVNIVDLGLVYRLEILKGDDGKYRVEADMTLTAAGCAMGPTIANDLKMRIESLPSVFEAQVNIVWDPPWNQDMMSEEARMILGLA